MGQALMKYDVVVIGSGLGGLTAGARLAREGRKVLVLERHYMAGGCATVFKRKDYTMEVGLHEMDGLHADDPKNKIFEELGVFDHVEFIKLPEFYRFVKGGVDIVIPHGVQGAIDALSEKFPAERKGIEKFFGKIIKMSREISRIPKRGWAMLLFLPFFPLLCPNVIFNGKKSVGGVLDACVADEDLKMAILANLGYYHDDPATASFLFYAMAQASYLTGGGHYIRGGSQNLSGHLARVITDNGGEVKKRHEAVGIDTEDGLAKSVRVRHVAGKKEEFSVECGAVVVNASAPDLVNRLAPGAFGDEYKAKINSLSIACSLLCVYIGFKRAVKELGNRHYATFVVDGDVEKAPDMFDASKRDFAEKSFSFVDYSQIDSGLAPEGKSMGAIVTIDYMSNWEGLSEDEYKRKKEAVGQSLLERLDKVIPGAKDAAEVVEVGTPVTIKRFTGNPQGSVYGFAQTPDQAGMNRIQSKTPVDNIYLASAWAFPGGGFSGAIFGGWICAGEILKGR